MIEAQLWTSWERVGVVVGSSVAVLIAVIAVIRVIGLRSLSKMSSFDFAVTVAIGSIIATVSATSASLADGTIAVASLLATQWAISTIRRRTNLEAVIDNTPLLLARDGELCEAAMNEARVTRSDIAAKMREANVLHRSDVLAVVLETTGDVSVLHGDGPLDEWLLDGVRNRAWTAGRIE